MILSLLWTVLAAFSFTGAVARLPVLAAFLPFFFLIFFYQARLLSTRNLTWVARIRTAGRWGGITLFGVLLVRYLLLA